MRRTVGTDRQEIEWQYTAPEGLKKVEEWLRGEFEPSFRLAILEGSSRELEDTYYDTGDWRLYRAGYALRVRRVEGGPSEATMKSLVSADGNLHRRREISEPLKSAGVEILLAASGPVGACLRELADAREVRWIFEIHTRRHTFDLLLDKQATDSKNIQTDGSAIRVGEVALDSSKISLDVSKESIYLTRVEVEIDASATTAFSELESFVKAMERDLKLRPAMASKYEVGLSAIARNPGNATNFKARESFEEE
jgi:triphosphatase